MHKSVALFACVLVGIALMPAAAGAAATGIPPQPVAIDVQHVIVAVGAPISLRATVTSAGSPLANATIHFSIVGTAVTASGITDGSGFAQSVIHFPSTLGVGQSTIRAEFLGNTGHKPAVATGDLSVLKSSTSMGGGFTLQGIPTGAPTKWYEIITGTLARNTDNTGLAGRVVRVEFDGVNSGAVATDAQGHFAINIPVVKPAGTYKLRLDFAGDNLYSPAGLDQTVEVYGPKTTIYYTKPNISVPGGKYVTGEDATITTKFTTGPDGSGTPVSGVHLLICLPVLQNQGFVSKYGGCDDATTDSAGVATKQTSLQVAGPNLAMIDLNPDHIRYVDGSHLETNFNVARSATKIVATVPSHMLSPGNQDIEASVVLAATGKPAKCVSLTFAYQPPNWPFGNPSAPISDGCSGKPIKLHVSFIDGWNPGTWKIKVSLDNNDGYQHSEAIYDVTVTALKVKAPTPITPH
jgi:hypothetical protein